MFIIKTLNSISPVYKTVLPQDLYDVTPSAENPDAIIVRSADMKGVEPPKSLLAVARAGAGYNNIPVEEFARKGIVVFNTPGANANAVRELAVAGLLLASRDIVGGINWAATLTGDDVPKQVEKGKNRFVGPELKGKTLGVIGLGEVGAQVANAGSALDMHVLGFDPYISVDHAWMLSRAIGRVKTEEELLRESDYVSVHIPLMDETRGSFNQEKLSHMKEGAVLLNLSRGELVVDEDILAALKSGRLRAYVTDFPNARLIGQKGVIAIPHLGASTPESEDNCVVMASRQIDQYLRNGSIKNSVNYPNCDLGDVAGHRIAILHANVPNVVGSITAVIAEPGINIGAMVNKSRGQFAYTVLDLDEKPGDGVVKKLRKLETVYAVRCF